MKKGILTSRLGLLQLSIFFLISCQQNLPVKKELWAVVINFFSPDTTNYPPTKKFPFPDSLQFATLKSIFSNQDKAPIISDSTIIFYDSYRENGERQCCKPDTLDIFIDTIKGKKYLSAIGDYLAVFQANNNSDTNLHTRRILSPVTLWGIRLNHSYPVEKFKDENEKLGTKLVKIDPRIDEVYRQKWNGNDSILLETIQFNNSAERVITSIYKDMNEIEMQATINELKNKFPGIKYKEAMQRDGEGKIIKAIRMNYQGISINVAQTNATEYSFTITDYYETMKLILNNAASSYVFRDDVKVY